MKRLIKLAGVFNVDWTEISKLNTGDMYMDNDENKYLVFSSKDTELASNKKMLTELSRYVPVHLDEIAETFNIKPENINHLKEQVPWLNDEGYGLYYSEDEKYNPDKLQEILADEKYIDLAWAEDTFKNHIKLDDNKSHKFAIVMMNGL